MKLRGGGRLETKMLSEICKVTKLAGYEFTKYVKYTDKGQIIAIRGLNIKNGGLNLENVKYIDGSNLEKLTRSKLQKNDILFTYVGTIGDVALIEENNKYYLAPNVSLIRPKEENILSKYLIYLFQTIHFKNNEINKWLNASSMKNLTMENIRKFKITIPPLKVQNEVVRILDKFSEISLNLEKGLPKEIDLRQKEYEFYRDLLLNFKKD